MLKKIVSSFCALVVFSGFCYAGPTAYNFGQPRPVNAGLRSLILPGWGQFFNGQKTKGYIVASAALVTLVGAYLLNNQANNTYTDYQNQGLKNGPTYSDYQNQQGQAEIVSFVCVGVWIYGVVDAYFNGKPSEPRAQSSTFFSVACSNKKSGLCLSQRF